MQRLSVRLQANVPDSPNNCVSLKRHSIAQIEARTDNTDLSKVDVSCSENIFVLDQSLVVRINVCGVICHFQQALNR